MDFKDSHKPLNGPVQSSEAVKQEFAAIVKPLSKTTQDFPEPMVLESKSRNPDTLIKLENSELESPIKLKNIINFEDPIKVDNHIKLDDPPKLEDHIKSENVNQKPSLFTTLSTIPSTY